MCNKICLASLVLAAAFLGLAGLALAQEPSPSQDPTSSTSQIPQSAVTVATVNIYDARITEQKDNVFKLAFDLSNGVSIQPDVKYAVQLVNTNNVIADERIYPEIINLGENQSISKQIEYQAPSYLQGDYKLWLISKNQSGMPLSNVLLGKATLAGDNKYVSLNYCYLGVVGEATDKRYYPYQGVDIESSEKLEAFCLANNQTDAEITITPNFVTNWRSTFGQVVETAPVDQSAITLKKGERKPVKIMLPLAQAPQAYDVTLAFQDAQNKTVSNQVVFHYVMRGLSATIQNLRLDKDYYTKGDIAKVSFAWASSADNFPNSRLGATDNGQMQAVITITDGQGKTCSALEKVLDQDSIIVSYDLPIIADCSNPKITASIQDGESKILDKREFLIESKTAPVSRATLSVAQKIAIGLVALLVFVVGIIFAFKYRKKQSLTIILFFLLFAGIFLVGNKKAEASTFVAGHVTYVSNIDKRSYQPGENITASGSGAWSWCANTFGRVALYVNTDINGYISGYGTDNKLFDESWYKYVELDYVYITQYFAETYAYDEWGDFIGVSYSPSLIPPHSVAVESGPMAITYNDDGSYTTTRTLTYSVPQLDAVTQTEVSRLQAMGFSCDTTWNYDPESDPPAEYYCTASKVSSSATLVAQSTPGSYTAWFKGCDGFENGCQPVGGGQYTTYGEAYAVVAPPVLTVTKAGTGSGTVTSNISGINCGSTCVASFSQGSTVWLTATPSSGSVFAGWHIENRPPAGYQGGCDEGSTGTCGLYMTSDWPFRVVATFTSVAKTLTVRNDILGSGSITSSPAGIDCGTSCQDQSASFTSDSSVTLTATPATTDYRFTGWSIWHDSIGYTPAVGDPCTDGATTCTLSMTEDKKIRANFERNTHTFTLVKAGTGTGSVAETDVGVNYYSCDSSCTSKTITLNDGADVASLASPSAGSVFAGWTVSGGSVFSGVYGTCNTDRCTVDLTSDVTLTATFNLASKPNLSVLGSITPNYLTGWAIAGSPTDFLATIQNSLSVSTGSGFTNLFQLLNQSTGAVTDIGTSAMGALGPSTSAATSLSYTFPSAAIPPNYQYMRVCADKSSSGDTGVISEVNESDNCGSWTAIQVGYPAISGTCSVSPTSGNTNDTYTWTVSATGGNGTYAYSWDGTDSLSGTSASVQKSYTTTGTKTGNVTITSGASSSQIGCANSATVAASIPVAPTTLTLSAQANCTSVNLSWTDNSSNETGFKIERKTGAGAFTQIATTAANATSYSDTGLTKNTAYVYRIRSTNTSGDSAYSSEVSVTTANDVWTPIASDVCINSTSSLTGSCGGTQPGVYITGSKYCPPEVTAVVAQSSSAIKITWKDQSNDETKFKIQEIVGGYWSWTMTGWFSWGWVWFDTWGDVGEVSTNVTTYTHTGLNPSSQHTYRVAVVRPAGTGYSTNTGSATTWALAAPTLNSVTPQSATKVNLGWTDNTTDESGFQIQRGTRGWLGVYTWTTLTPNTVANAVSYQDTGLAPNTTYYYRLRTVRGSFYSAYSAIMTASSLGDPVVDIKVGDANDSVNNPPSDNPSPINALADLRITWSTTHSSRISGLCTGTGQGWAGTDKATSGDDSGGNLNDFSAGTYTYTITCNKTDGGTTVDAVTVTVKDYSITITKAGTGSGSVTPSTGTLSWSGNTGTASYNAGTSITLTAAASSDSNFVGWSAPCVSSGTGTCTFTTVAANSVPIVATFTLKNYTFSVTKSGSGTITGNGINCGSTCSAPFDHGTAVTLTATPDAGNLFDSWSGCDSTSGNTCTVNVNGAENVAATFSAKTLSVSLSASPSTGAGSLTSTLTATVTGTAVGTINYTFYCNRNDDGTNVTSPNDGKYDGEAATTKSHTCTYSSVGTFYPKVIVERDSSVSNATDKKTVTVTNQAPTASNLTASSIAASNYCTVPSHTLSWVYSDPDGNAQSQFQLQVDDDSGFGSPAIDRTVVATVASGGSNSQQAQVAVAAIADKLLYNDTTYNWRVKVWDSYGLVSSNWINGTSFKTAKHIFPTVNFKSFPTIPSMNEVVQFTDLTVGGAAMTNWTWSIQDADYQDGTTANSQNPRIKFNKTGTKNIVLTVRDGDNYQCSNTDEGDSLQNVKIKLQLPGWKEQ